MDYASIVNSHSQNQTPNPFWLVDAGGRQDLSWPGDAKRRTFDVKWCGNTENMCEN